MILLTDIVPQNYQSPLVFDRINGDLGAASNEILAATPRVQMAYAYARRTAAAALYVQGYFKEEVYEYVHSIFKSVQINTDSSVEFQERALDDAVAFMQTYHHIITRKFSKSTIRLAQEYEITPGHLDDAGLFQTVLETMHENRW